MAADPHSHRLLNIAKEHRGPQQAVGKPRPRSRPAGSRAQSGPEAPSGVLQEPVRPTPVCIRTCRVSWLGFWNVFPQCGQEYVKLLLSMFLLYDLVPATLGSRRESTR